MTCPLTNGICPHPHDSRCHSINDDHNFCKWWVENRWVLTDETAQKLPIQAKQDLCDWATGPKKFNFAMMSLIAKVQESRAAEGK